MKRITAVKPLAGYKLDLSFDDGTRGIVDLSSELDKDLFASWKDPSHFESVRITHNGRSLEWSGGADLCADALYLEISGMRVEELFPNCQRDIANA